MIHRDQAQGMRAVKVRVSLERLTQMLKAEEVEGLPEDIRVVWVDQPTEGVLQGYCYLVLESPAFWPVLWGNRIPDIHEGWDRVL